MRSLSRRKILKDTTIITGFSIIAGFPKLFPLVLASNDPPKESKASKKVVSPSKPTDKKTNKNDNKNTNKNDKKDDKKDDNKKDNK
jgi:hypothetical protein